MPELKLIQTRTTPSEKRQIEKAAAADERSVMSWSKRVLCWAAGVPGYPPPNRASKQKETGQ